ncbi:hypothetical protein [Dolichospermum phage Dfl-JY45]
MTRWNHRHFAVVKRALQHATTRVPVNMAWREVVEGLDCGRISGDEVILGPEDRRRLRQVTQSAWGFDPLVGPPQGSRLAVSLGARDDKISRISPDAGFVLARGDFGPAVPDSWSLRLPAEAIPWGRFRWAAVVENLDVFDTWRPGDAILSGSPIVLYRGHDGIAAGVKAALATMPSELPVVVFPDFDPAGLQIALTMDRATHLLAPAHPQKLDAFHAHPDYDAQIEARTYLGSGVSSDCVREMLWPAMREHQISCKQQHLIARAIPLALYAL